MAAALRGVIESAVVGAPADMALGSRSLGDLHRSRIFNRSHKHVATADKRNHFAVGRHNGIASLNVDFPDFGGNVGCDINSQTFGFGRCAGHGVDSSVVSESQLARFRRRQETHRMSGEIGEAACCRRIVGRKRPQIESAAVAFTEKIDGLAVGAHYRIAVFAGAIGNVTVFPGLKIIRPYVAANRRGVMFAPFILKPFDILIIHHFTVGRERGHLSRRSENLP